MPARITRGWHLGRSYTYRCLSCGRVFEQRSRGEPRSQEVCYCGQYATCDLPKFLLNTPTLTPYAQTD